MKNEEFAMIIKGNSLDDKLVMEIGKFSILWNCFERFQCDNFCNPKKIKEVYSLISIDKANQAELAKVLNKGVLGLDKLFPNMWKRDCIPVTLIKAKRKIGF